MFPFGPTLLQYVLGWFGWAAKSQDDQALWASATPFDLTLPDSPCTSPTVGHVHAPSPTIAADSNMYP